MPEDGQFSEREIEQGLRDLGPEIEYPTTPDVARAVRRRLDEEAEPRHARRTRRWPSFLAPRWTAAAATLVLVAIVALSPALRTTLSDLIVPQAGQESGGSAAKPEGVATQDRYQQEAAGAPEVACPSPSIEAVPARGVAGAKFRLRGHGFSSGCDGATPARGVEISLRQRGETWKLATLDADRDLALDAGLRVPRSAGPGKATLLANVRSGETVETRFLVLP